MSLIVFDLDGTLVDPLAAMAHCAGEACAELGLLAPSPAEISRFVGFGASELFASMPGMQEPGRLDQAVAAYWRHFEAHGVTEYRVYDGILLMLNRLKHQGHRLYVVTVKPTRYARRILHELDLLLCFDEVIGTAAQERWKSKADVIAQLQQQGTLAPGGLIVGDRADDLASGKANGLKPLGVTYGYGSLMELQDAGAERTFDSVEALDAWFEANLAGNEIHDAFSLSE